MTFQIYLEIEETEEEKINRIFSLSDCCKLLAEECRWESCILSLVAGTAGPPTFNPRKRFKMEKLKPEEIQMVGTIYVEQQRPFQLRN